MESTNPSGWPRFTIADTANWLIGQQIVEAEQGGTDYGRTLLKTSLSG
jgi:hypothetical protein